MVYMCDTVRHAELHFNSLFFSFVRSMARENFSKASNAIQLLWLTNG